MTSNFDFLAENWNFLLEDVQRVEAFALQDPRTAAFYARRTLERCLHWLYKNDTALKAPYEKNLAAMIHEPTFKNNIKRGLFQDVKFVHRLGNLAVHDDQTISSQDGMQTCSAIFRFTGWLARVYTRGGAVPAQFNITLLPKADTNEKQVSAAELQKVLDQLETKEQAEAAAAAKHEQTEEELNELREQLTQLQAVKEQNKQKIPSSDYTEAETRDAFIDVMLREAGWDPKAKNVPEYEVHGMPSGSGVGFVDYVLWGADGKPLAVVEAKKTRVDPDVGKHQAKLYADCLENQFGRRPIIFYTNGYNTWLWDDTEYPPREVQGFYEQDELQWLVNRRGTKLDLTTLQPDSNITARYYQIEAAARVMQNYEVEKRRRALIVMATGSGKTRLSMSIVDMLMKGNRVRRVLFLADRIALVNQAKREYGIHLKNVSTASLLDKGSGEARVVFSTYPTMLNLIDGSKKDQSETYSVGHFDLIIIDEAHRSVYQKYGAIFEYFDSLILGLTATPRGEVDRNTYRLFKLQDHQPTYAYELEQAVADEFLVPPKALSVPLKFPRDGIKYHELSPEEQEEYEQEEQFYDEETGKLKEEISSSALNQWLFNEDTVDKVLMHVMENGIKIDGGDSLGKTIIFAKNKNHADFIVKRFDHHYPKLAGKFCQKLDYSVKYVQNLINTFSLPDNSPQIAVSVDMLDTGIDVPDVVNLVFFKIVRSKTKFWQMIGRGTRLRPDLFGPGDDKTCFYVFDYLQNFEFFGENPDGYEAPTQASLKEMIFRRRLTLALSLQEGAKDDVALQTLSSEQKDLLHLTVSAYNMDNFIIRKERETVVAYREREAWNSLTIDNAELVATKLAKLPVIDDDQETARRFDLLILNLQIAILQKNASQKRYQELIIDIATNLEEKNAIPMVAAQMELILALQTDEWWADITLPMLEEVRKRVRDLTQFVDAKSTVYKTYTHFEDELDEAGVTEINIIETDTQLKDYRKRVEKLIRSHGDHITIHRLKNNEPVSHADVKALEEMLFSQDEGIPKDEYERLYGDEPVGRLVRSIVGLSMSAAKEAFGEFLQDDSLHPDQISFLNEVVEYLVKNGTMKPESLFHTPFTFYHDQGVTGVLGADYAKKVVSLVERINKNADAA